jgi:hypothetical protein
MPRRRGRTRILAAGLAALVLSTSAAACTDDDTGSVAEFCKQVKRLPPLDTVLRGYSGLDAQELQARLDAARTGYDDLADAAPGDIGDDVDRVAELVRLVVRAVADHPDDPDAVAREVQRGTREISGSATASQRVVAYAKDHCQVDLDPT